MWTLWVEVGLAPSRGCLGGRCGIVTVRCRGMTLGARRGQGEPQERPGPWCPARHAGSAAARGEFPSSTAGPSQLPGRSHCAPRRGYVSRARPSTWLPTEHFGRGVRIMKQERGVTAEQRGQDNGLHSELPSLGAVPEIFYLFCDFHATCLGRGCQRRMTADAGGLLSAAARGEWGSEMTHGFGVWRMMLLAADYSQWAAIRQVGALCM